MYGSSRSRTVASSAVLLSTSWLLFLAGPLAPRAGFPASSPALFAGAVSGSDSRVLSRPSTAVNTSEALGRIEALELTQNTVALTGQYHKGFEILANQSREQIGVVAQVNYRCGVVEHPFFLKRAGQLKEGGGRGRRCQLGGWEQMDAVARRRSGCLVEGLFDPNLSLETASIRSPPVSRLAFACCLLLSLGSYSSFGGLLPLLPTSHAAHLTRFCFPTLLSAERHDGHS